MLESAHLSALFGGAAIRKMLGKFAEILAILHPLQQVIGFLSQRRYFRILFSLRTYKDLPHGGLLGAHELAFMFVVIPLHLRMIQDNFRPYFVPNHLLLEKLVSDIVFKILEGYTTLINLRLQIFHGCDIVLYPNLVQTLDHISVDVTARILAALNEQGIVDEVAQHVLIFRRHPLINLFRRALGTILLRFLLHLASRALQVAAGNHFVIYSCYDL